MAYSVITFENPHTGQIRQAPVGFSWSSLFLGGFVPLYRGDYKWFLLWWLISLATAGFAWVVLPFKYNDMYIRQLQNEGFVEK